MKLINEGLLCFDTFLPLYNWFYPVENHPVRYLLPRERMGVFDVLSESPVASRALYLHVPFCETICSFCPLNRGPIPNDELVEQYTQALLREIEIKGQYAFVRDVPIRAIFIGGGSPSVLNPDQINRIGRRVRDTFDCSEVAEFSVEMEVKSVTEERLQAFKEIGVTHPRFGVQTFDPVYREAFCLTATLDQVYAAAALLTEHFSFVCADILFGMNGQTEEQFFSDVRAACSLGLPTLDFFPINNLVTQTKLHQTFEELKLPPRSGLWKFCINVLLDEIMRHQGYMPHNGHGFVKVPPGKLNWEDVVTDHYSFLYHKHVHGYPGWDVLGFGCGAVSMLRRYTAINVADRIRYINTLLSGGTLEFELREHSAAADASRGIIMHLPYHGYADKAAALLPDVHSSTLRSLQELVDAGLVIDQGDILTLSRAGRYWYMNLMYYLCPPEERAILDGFVKDRWHAPGRLMAESEVKWKLHLSAR